MDATKTDLIDSDTLAGLLELGADDPEFFPQMVDLYRTIGKAKVARLPELLAEGKLPDIARLCHELKSSTGNFGAQGLMKTFAEIERQAQAGAAEQVRAGIVRAEALYPQVEAALLEVVKNPPKGK